MKKALFLLTVFCMLSVGAFSQALVSDTINIAHFDIHLDIVYLSQHKISGYTVLKVKAKQNAVSNISLDLLKMNIDSISVEGQPVTAYSYNDTVLRIPLTQALNAGDSLTLTVAYHGQPVVDGSGWGGFYFNGDSVYAFNLGVGFQANPHNYGRVWFPCIDDFHDRGTYDFFIKVKNGNTAVCNGTLEQVQSDTLAGTKLYHWRLHSTIPSYLASVAVGPYVAVNDTFSSSSGRQVPIAIYVPQSKVQAVQGTFSRLKLILAAYESAYGPYRWERVGYVGVPFNSGAMEHATNIAIGLGYITGNYSYESLYAHELSHHWFGDLVTCNSAPEMWLNEGWAVFSEMMYKELLFGKEVYKDEMRSLLKSVITYAHRNDNGYWSLDNIPQQYTYGSTVYDKGATVAHSLRGYLGDSLFFPMLHAYFSQNQFTHMSNTGFRDFITSQTGINMNGFFDAWVFQPGFVHFSIDSFSVSPLGNKFLVKVYLRQRLWHKPSLANDNRIYVRAADKQWKFKDRLLQFSGSTGMDTMVVDFAPDFLMIDPEEQLADATVDYLKTVNTTGLIDMMDAYFRLDVKQINDSALLRITHNYAAPDTAGTMLPGLKISSHRYWTVKGIFPQGFDATGRFFYSKFNELDDDLIVNSQDSLVILWRRGAGDRWHKINFTRMGPWTTGYFYVDHLKQGEYAVAVWDAQHAGFAKNQKAPEDFFTVSPNPTKGAVKIRVEDVKNWKIKVYDTAGRQVALLKGGNSKSKRFRIGGKLMPGIYFFVLYDSFDNIIDKRKIILTE